MSSFHEVLKQLQTERNLSIIKLSHECGIPYRTLQNYLLKLREPNIKSLILLSDYFHVSVDYLLGLTDNPVRL